MGRFRFNKNDTRADDGIVRFQDISEINDFVRKDELDQIITENELVTAQALNDLEKRKLEKEEDPLISGLKEPDIDFIITNY